MIKTIIYIIILHIIFIPENSIAGNNMPPVIVYVDDVVELEISPTVLVSGSVISRYDSRISSEVEGRIINILDVGDRVKKGDVIGKIENTKYQLNYNEIHAEIEPIESLLKFYTSETERLKKLAIKNNAAKNQLEQIQANKNEAIAKIKLIRAKMATAYDLLSRTTIKAPFDGVITDRFKSIGENVNINNEIVRLVNTDFLEIQTYIQRESFPYIKLGDYLEIESNNLKTNGIVTKLIPVGDVISRLYEIRIQFDNKIWPVGTAVKIACPINQKKNVLAIPRDALVIRQSGVVIYRINSKNTAELIPVKTGISNKKYIEIIGNINLNDKIVTRGNERLRPGQMVNIIKDSED